ncbi:MAG: hypothetical protein R2688_00365 [Fimbriimonadaceae bacterium]
MDDENPSSHQAIVHSRWATHGAPIDLNAHPHYDHGARIALIHNGIIENYIELKEELVRHGHIFQSETDSEVAAHIVGQEYQEGVPLEEAVRRAVKKLRGAFAFVVVSVDEPDKVVYGMPARWSLVLGKTARTWSPATSRLCSLTPSSSQFSKTTWSRWSLRMGSRSPI